jgi:hypothetical protein
LFGPDAGKKGEALGILCQRSDSKMAIFVGHTDTGVFLRLARDLVVHAAYY